MTLVACDNRFNNNSVTSSSETSSEVLSSEVLSSEFSEVSKENFLEVVEKDVKKEITYKSAKAVSILKKFETKAPTETLEASNMTQEEFDRALLEEMGLEVGKAVEETYEGDKVTELRISAESISEAPEGTKFYVSGDKLKIEANEEAEGRKVKTTSEYNEYGYGTYTYTYADISMPMSNEIEITIKMVTETKVTYTK